MHALTSKQMTALIVQLDEEDGRIHAVVGSGASSVMPLVTPEPGDQTDVAEREIAQREADAMLEHYRMQLADIGAARARMAIGAYGRCIDCHAPISFARLSAYPTAKRCAECQRTHERRRAVPLS
nr:TraR/DksA family transcriptional regulator [uncultured Cupriavidus sp.]